MTWGDIDRALRPVLDMDAIQKRSDAVIEMALPSRQRGTKVTTATIEANRYNINHALAAAMDGRHAMFRPTARMDSAPTKQDVLLTVAIPQEYTEEQINEAVKGLIEHVVDIRQKYGVVCFLNASVDGLPFRVRNRFDLYVGQVITDIQAYVRTLWRPKPNGSAE